MEESKHYKDDDQLALCICGHCRSDHILVHKRALPEHKACTKCPEYRCLHFYPLIFTYT